MKDNDDDDDFICAICGFECKIELMGVHFWEKHPREWRKLDEGGGGLGYATAATANNK